MARIRLQIQVLPWQISGQSADANPINQHEIKPWLQPEDPNNTLDRVVDNIAHRYARIYVGRGDLRVKELQDFWGNTLDLSDKVCDIFDDRISSGDNLTSICKVLRYAPEQQEIFNPTRFASLLPESAARPQKRPPPPLFHAPQRQIPSVEEADYTDNPRASKRRRVNADDSPQPSDRHERQHQPGQRSRSGSSEEQSDRHSVLQITDSQSTRISGANRRSRPSSPQRGPQNFSHSVPDSPAQQRRGPDTTLHVAPKIESPEIRLSVIAAAPLVKPTANHEEALPQSEDSLSQTHEETQNPPVSNIDSAINISSESQERQSSPINVQTEPRQIVAQSSQELDQWDMRSKKRTGDSIYDPIETDTESLQGKQTMFRNKRSTSAHRMPSKIVTPFKFSERPEIYAPESHETRQTRSKAKPSTVNGKAAQDVPVSTTQKVRTPLAAASATTLHDKDGASRHQEPSRQQKAVMVAVPRSSEHRVSPLQSSPKVLTQPVGGGDPSISVARTTSGSLNGTLIEMSKTIVSRAGYEKGQEESGHDIEGPDITTGSHTSRGARLRVGAMTTASDGTENQNRLMSNAGHSVSDHHPSMDLESAEQLVDGDDLQSPSNISDSNDLRQRVDEEAPSGSPGELSIITNLKRSIFERTQPPEETEIPRIAAGSARPSGGAQRTQASDSQTLTEASPATNPISSCKSPVARNHNQRRAEEHKRRDAPIIESFRKDVFGDNGVLSQDPQTPMRNGQSPGLEGSLLANSRKSGRNNLRRSLTPLIPGRPAVKATYGRSSSARTENSYAISSANLRSAMRTPSVTSGRSASRVSFEERKADNEPRSKGAARSGTSNASRSASTRSFTESSTKPGKQINDIQRVQSKLNVVRDKKLKGRAPDRRPSSEQTDDAKAPSPNASDMNDASTYFSEDDQGVGISKAGPSVKKKEARSAKASSKNPIDSTPYALIDPALPSSQSAQVDPPHSHRIDNDSPGRNVEAGMDSASDGKKDFAAATSISCSKSALSANARRAGEINSDPESESASEDETESEAASVAKSESDAPSGSEYTSSDHESTDSSSSEEQTRPTTPPGKPVEGRLKQSKSASPARSPSASSTSDSGSQSIQSTSSRDHTNEWEATSVKQEAEPPAPPSSLPSFNPASNILHTTFSSQPSRPKIYKYPSLSAMHREAEGPNTASFFSAYGFKPNRTLFATRDAGTALPPDGSNSNSDDDSESTSSHDALNYPTGQAEHGGEVKKQGSFRRGITDLIRRAYGSSQA